MSSYAAALLLFILDRLFKRLALNVGDTTPSGLADFALFLNGGVAFSIPAPNVPYVVIGSVIFAVLLVASVNAAVHSSPAAVPLAFVLAGAASNLLDRFLFDATIDYLIFFERSAVNLADGMIVCGVLSLLLSKRHTRSANNANDPAGDAAHFHDERRV